MKIDVQDLTNYKSVPFYSLNDKLEKAELIEQINHMHDVGMGGFFLHARGGLRTEYMSDEWFEIMQCAIDEAEKLKMNVWFYDENGWPSGFGGGKLLKEEYFVPYLEMKELAYYDDNAYAVYAKVDGKIIRIKEKKNAEVYYNVYLCFNNTYVDILNPKVTSEFIKITHEEYYKRFHKYFGNVVKGFFTDEPQYFRIATPFSTVLPGEFLKRYHYDVKDRLLALFIDIEGGYEFRFQYWKLMNDLFVNNYQKMVYDWCESHNCMATGHTIEETSLYGQMLCCAGVMPYYEYEHIPGIDWLTRFVYNEISPKQLSSVCEQLGKKQCITETFGASGHFSTPKDFKAIAEFQFVAGVNLLCQHLYPYSVSGIRKRDFPPYFSKFTKWCEESKGFNDYFTKLGYIISNNQEKVDTLMVHPLYSAYLLYDRNNPHTLAEIETVFHNLANDMVKHQLPHHFGDETIMSKYAKIENGKLIIKEQSYSTIVLPKLLNVSSSTKNILTEFVRQGGKLVCEYGLPEYVDGVKDSFNIAGNTTLQQVYETARIKIESKNANFIRSRLCGKYFFVISTNPTENVKATFKIKNSEKVLQYDLLSDTISKVDFTKNDDELIFEVCLNAYESKMFIIDSFEKAEEIKKCVNTTDITNYFAINKDYSNYFLIDKASYSFDDVNYVEKTPICHIMDKLLVKKYSGSLYLKADFNNLNYNGALNLLIEENDTVEAFINGEKVEKSALKKVNGLFNCYPINKLKIGKNELKLKYNFIQSDYIYYVLFGEGVTETLKNNLTLKTELESFAIEGNFVVGNDSKIENELFNVYNDDNFIAESCNVDLSNITGSGYPFCHEVVEVKGAISLFDTSYALKIDHSFDCVKVKVNGKCVGVSYFLETLDVSKYLNVGKNELELYFYPSSQLLFGAHHLDCCESTTITPDHFGYNSYVNHSIKYVEERSVKKQGIKSIEIIELL